MVRPIPQNAYRARYAKGVRAEIWATVFLIAKGYWPLARRYKTRHGEADLIMRRGRMLVFLEVKARDTMPDGLAAISQRSQVRIAAAASHFLGRFPRYQGFDCRFDAIVVRPYRLPYHVPDAWRL
jgi:putative endonuclease